MSSLADIVNLTPEALLSDLAPLGVDLSAVAPFVEAMARGAAIERELLTSGGGGLTSTLPKRVPLRHVRALCMRINARTRSPLWFGPAPGLGGTAGLTSGNDYAASQLSSRALWEHSDQPDGVVYRSRHDDSAPSVALYDRARDGLAIVTVWGLTN